MILWLCASYSHRSCLLRYALILLIMIYVYMVLSNVLCLVLQPKFSCWTYYAFFVFIMLVFIGSQVRMINLPLIDHCSHFIWLLDAWSSCTHIDYVIIYLITLFLFSLYKYSNVKSNKSCASVSGMTGWRFKKLQQF